MAHGRYAAWCALVGVLSSIVPLQRDRTSYNLVTATATGPSHGSVGAVQSCLSRPTARSCAQQCARGISCCHIRTLKTRKVSRATSPCSLSRRATKAHSMPSTVKAAVLLLHAAARPRTVVALLASCQLIKAMVSLQKTIVLLNICSAMRRQSRVSPCDAQELIQSGAATVRMSDAMACTASLTSVTVPLTAGGCLISTWRAGS